MDSDLLSQNVYSVLGNAIEMLKDGRFTKEQSEKYIYEWFEKLVSQKHKFTKSDQLLYEKIKPVRHRLPVTFSFLSLFGGK
ncbi:hypothetical protein LACDD01_00834 [Lactococcus sp. DD01]|nr:hypothetical protein LACDD01_00834 [Lactococcus sp. DD01]